MLEDAEAEDFLEQSRLFSVRQITAATFIGAPIAGALFLARNYRALGLETAARQSLQWGVVATLLVFLIAYLLPDRFPNSALPIGYCFAMHQLAGRLQGRAISDHLRAGGMKGSWAPVIGWSVLCLVIIVILIFALFAVLSILVVC